MERFDKSKFGNDLKQLLETILKEHPHPKITQEQIDKLVSFYESSNMRTFYSSFYYLQTIMAKIGDSNTIVTLPKSENRMTGLSFKMVDDKCVVSNAYGKEELLGKVVKSINGVDINILIEELSKIIPNITKEKTNQEIAFYLSNKKQLSILPSYISQLNDDFDDVISYSFEGLDKPYQEPMSDNNLEVIKDYEEQYGNHFGESREIKISNYFDFMIAKKHLENINNSNRNLNDIETNEQNEAFSNNQKKSKFKTNEQVIQNKIDQVQSFTIDVTNDPAASLGISE